MASRLLSLLLLFNLFSFLSPRLAAAETILYRFDESASSELREAVNAALLAWSEQLPINVAQCFGPVQHCVIFRIVEPSHGDLAPFSSILNPSPAHTLFRGPSPIEVHFNRELLFASGMGKQELYKVALHEVGHLIGIPHSSNQGSIMYPIRIRKGLEQEILPGDIEKFRHPGEDPVKASEDDGKKSENFSCKPELALRVDSATSQLSERVYASVFF